ncbi:ROK family transcriptional regulator [Kushneria aurantia]|uniref:ROK family protein n=1 Tax=Kushneria aurantia TaxID=504092 RepID=A0ABV6FZS8_9GAMM|nr:ROK family transcriptional regulator [Kushneria aurantia]
MAVLHPPRFSGDLGSLKQRNRRALLDLVRHTPGLTRAELAQRSGLTKMTVGNAVQALLGGGWLTEGELHRNGSGRPGRALHPGEQHHLLLGVEVGVDELRLMACTLTGRPLAQRCLGHNGAAPGEAARLLARELIALRAACGTGRRLLGMGVALPGPVMPDEPLLGLAPNLGWRRVRFLDLLDAHLPDDFGLRLMDNESSLAAFGEVWFAHRRVPSLLYLNADIGIGSGLVENSGAARIISGVHGLAGEVGHTLLAPDGALCRCGNRGCAETLVSGWMLRERFGLSADDDLAAAVARLPTRETAPVLARAGRALGVLLHNLHHSLNPAEIVIGGELTTLGETLLSPALKAFAESQRRLLPDAPLVVPEVLSDSRFMAARGAAARVLDVTLAQQSEPV